MQCFDKIVRRNGLQFGELFLLTNLQTAITIHPTNGFLFSKAHLAILGCVSNLWIAVKEDRPRLCIQIHVRACGLQSELIPWWFIRLEVQDAPRGYRSVNSFCDMQQPASQAVYNSTELAKSVAYTFNEHFFAI